MIKYKKIAHTNLPVKTTFMYIFHNLYYLLKKSLNVSITTFTKDEKLHNIVYCNIS